MRAFPVTRYAVVTCEVKLLQVISAFVDVPTEIILPKIILKLFQRLIAAHEYFQTRQMSLKLC